MLGMVGSDDRSKPVAQFVKNHIEKLMMSSVWTAYSRVKRQLTEQLMQRTMTSYGHHGRTCHLNWNLAMRRSSAINAQVAVIRNAS